MYFLDLLEALIDAARDKLRPREIKGSAKRRTGDKAEDFALAFLEKQGFALIERNLGDEKGELDLVGHQRGYDGIVVVEVRARKEGSMMTPREAVDGRKQRQVVKTARRLLKRKGLRGPVRFDIVGVYLSAEGEPMRAERFERAFR
ncbi:hypothetical protein BAC2_01955 [uncultured bacterium]|nr:hypothetical protein BAC2_01955 [uncultured bacterium]